jgi:hypothetical protein
VHGPQRSYFDEALPEYRSPTLHDVVAGWFENLVKILLGTSGIQPRFDLRWRTFHVVTLSSLRCGGHLFGNFPNVLRHLEPVWETSPAVPYGAVLEEFSVQLALNSQFRKQLPCPHQAFIHPDPSPHRIARSLHPPRIFCIMVPIPR